MKQLTTATARMSPARLLLFLCYPVPLDMVHLSTPALPKATDPEVRRYSITVTLRAAGIQGAP